MKIGEFFEKYVQWIAMGLAGVWILWVLWAYGWNRPQVEINGQSYSAGNIDEHIRDTDMQQLATKMGDPNVPAALVDVPDFTDAFVSAMNGKNAGTLPIVVNSPPPYQEVVIPKEPRAGRFVKGQVKELPKVVMPTQVAVISGRSQVIVEKPRFTPIINPSAVGNANGNAANPDPARPNIFNDNPQPQPAAGVDAAAAPPLPGQPPGVQADKTWVSVFAKLNFTEQDKEFTRVNLPNFLLQKQYIEVQLQRQEVLPDGTFGTVELVRGLTMNQPPVDRSKPADFIKWSADAEIQKMILAPPFYFVVKGTAWEMPNKPAAVVAQAPVQFDLVQKYQEWKQLKNKAEQDKFIAAMTPEQRKQFHDFRLAEEEKERKAKAPPPTNNRAPQRYVPPPQRGGPGGAGGAGGNREGRGNFDAVDPALLREMYADSNETINRRRMPEEYDSVYSRKRELYRRAFGDDYMRRRAFEGYDPMQQQPMQGQQQILGNLIPDATGNVDIWAHDETAAAGRTYRYRLRAVIKNPLYDIKNVAAPDSNLEKPPYLPADLASGGLDANASWSDWSKPVAIPTNVDMMLVSAQSSNGREFARFRVKRFQEGQINEAPKAFEVFPGDTIGGKEKVNVNAAGANPGVVTPAKQMEVDFTTNWMLVDIRQTGNDYRVRIMDPQGRMEVRTVSGDRNKFKDEPAKTGAAAAGTSVGLLTRPPN
ncbi:MAG TPA: hypothetical protein VGP94_02970 [Tepidisphaeraceae bacterium]|nr:hypothetical protein [Tepidisphaeraceae bacterium]